MSTELLRGTVKAGALIRRHFRPAFDMLGVSWVEHRGLIDSTFVVTGTSEQWARLSQWIREAGGVT